MAFLSDYGVESIRIYGQEELGRDFGDLDSDLGRIEVKRKKTLPQWLNLGENIRFIMVRKDRGQWYIVLRGHDAVQMMLLKLVDKIVDQGEREANEREGIRREDTPRNQA